MIETIARKIGTYVPTVPCVPNSGDESYNIYC